MDLLETIGKYSFAQPITAMGFCNNLVIVHQSNVIRTYLNKVYAEILLSHFHRTWSNVYCSHKKQSHFTYTKLKISRYFLEHLLAPFLNIALWYFIFSNIFLTEKPSNYVKTLKYKTSVKCVTVDSKFIYSGAVDKTIRVIDKQVFIIFNLKNILMNRRYHLYVSWKAIHLFAV